MPIPKTEKIWYNGKFIRWDDANIHVLSHVVSYASAVFDGMRCYKTKQGPAFFRLRDHMQRLVHSAYIYRMEVPYTVDQLCAAGLELVRENHMAECYVKPDRPSRLRRSRSESFPLPHRGLHGLLGMGQVSRP